MVFFSHTLHSSIDPQETTRILTPSSQIAFILTLTFIVLAPVFVAAGNYLLIGRLIRSVLPTTHHRVFGINARLLTRIFVAFDVISFFIQSAGSGVASAQDWQGPMERIGRYILIGGLSLQCLTLAWYLAIFARFHTLANRMEVDTAPRGWRSVMKAVYVSSSLIMVCRLLLQLPCCLRGEKSKPLTASENRFDPSTASPNSPRALTATLSATSGSSGSLRPRRCSSPSASFACTIPAGTSAATAPASCSRKRAAGTSCDAVLVSEEA